MEHLRKEFQTPSSWQDVIQKKGLNGIKDLHQQGVAVDLKDKTGVTALQCAILQGSFIIVQYLLTQGANIVLPDQNESTLLHEAIASLNAANTQSEAIDEKQKILQCLIEVGAETTCHGIDFLDNLAVNQEGYKQHRTAYYTHIHQLFFKELSYSEPEISALLHLSYNILRWKAYHLRQQEEIVKEVVEKAPKTQKILQRLFRVETQFTLLSHLKNLAQYPSQDKPLKFHTSFDDYDFHNFFEAQENSSLPITDLKKLCSKITRNSNISFNSNITSEILCDDQARLKWFAGLNQNFSTQQTDQLFKNIWEDTLSDYLKQTLPNNIFQLFKALQGSLNEFDTYDTYLLDDQGYTPLHHAVEAENFPAVQWLLQKGIDPALLNQEKDTAFHLAAKKANRFKILQALCQAAHMRYGSDINEIINQINHNNRRTPLHVAIKCNNLAAVKLLLNEGADPLIKERAGFNAFYIAICNWNTPEALKAIEYLCNAVENQLQVPDSIKTVLNQKDKNGNILLNYAINRQNLPIIELLLKKGSNPLFNRTGYYPYHPSTLCAAIHSANDEILPLLLQYAEQDKPALLSALNQRDQRGNNLFDYARETRSPSIVQHLYPYQEQSQVEALYRSDVLVPLKK